MDASIVICTYQRADSLNITLGCLAAQRVPEEFAWEVLVVDNNSTDHTRATVDGWETRLPNLRYLFEPRQGLSHARNLGIKESQGKYLLFTDDDVCPAPDWLSRMVQAMEHTGCAAAGGYIAPDWERPPPAWLTPRFYGFLALKIEQGEPHPLKADDPLPFGANMAFRRNLFDQIGVFDIHRGRQGKTLASGEDGELFQRILAAGLPVWYFPQARVRHRIEGFRLRRRYFWRWRYHTSRNLALTHGVPSGRKIGGIPLYLVPQTLRAFVRALAAPLAVPGDEAVHRQMMLAHFLGTLAGLRQRAKVTT